MQDAKPHLSYPDLKLKSPNESGNWITRKFGATKCTAAKNNVIPTGGVQNAILWKFVRSMEAMRVWHDKLNVCHYKFNTLHVMFYIYSPSLPKSMVIKTQIPQAYLCRGPWAMCKFSINMLYKVFETCHIASYKSQFNERGGSTSQYKKQTSYHKYHFSWSVSARGSKLIIVYFPYRPPGRDRAELYGMWCCTRHT